MNKDRSSLETLLLKADKRDIPEKRRKILALEQEIKRRLDDSPLLQQANSVLRV